MLINVWENVLRAMDDGKDAVVLLGIDFQKTFNRMEFAVCIEQLEKLGASQGSLSMVMLFLTNRKMNIERRLTRFDVVCLVYIFHYCTDIYRCESMNASDKSRLTHYE